MFGVVEKLFYEGLRSVTFHSWSAVGHLVEVWPGEPLYAHILSHDQQQVEHYTTPAELDHVFDRFIKQFLGGG